MIAWAVRRPAVVWASAAALLLAGGVAFTKLPLATKPRIELPRLSVASTWNGASAELVESYIAAPIEAAVQSVRGVRRVDSESGEGSASLTVHLDERANVQLTRLAVLERLELLRDQLPDGATRPTVSNFVPSELEESPLLTYTMAGPYTPGALAAIGRRMIVPRLATIPGVAGVDLQGGAEIGASVSYDAARLRQLGVAPGALAEALRSSRITQSMGDWRRADQVVAVTLRDEPASLAMLADLPVRGSGGRTLRLGDVADIRAQEDARGRFNRIDGQPAINLDISRQPSADAIHTAAAVRAAVARIEAGLPPGIQLRLERDESEDLARQLADLVLRGVVAFALVVLVLAVALRRASSVALVMLSALVAVAGTALGLYLLHIPANLLTLAGLGMGIGILVQNGVVVVDRLGGAADTVDGRTETAQRITPAILGATMTTAVVLLPFLFLQGDARAAFVPFAAAFALALGWSVLSSLVMIPAIAPALRASRRAGWASRAYRRVMIRVVRWRLAVLLLFAAVVGVVTWGFITKVPRWSFGSWYGQRERLTATIGFPRGSDPVSLDAAMREFEAIVVGREGVESVDAHGYGDRASLYVTFARNAGAIPFVLQEELTRRAVLVGGAQIGVYYQGPGFYSGGGGGSINQRIKLLGYSYEGLEQAARDLKARLEHIPRVRDVDINAGSYGQRERAFEVVLRPDRAALARFGLTAQDLAAAVGREVAGAVGGTQLLIGGEELRVTLKAAGARERTMDELAAALVPNPLGAPVRIGDVARVEEREVLSRISRQDQQYVRIMSYEFRGPAKLANRTHTAFMKSITLPAGYSASDDGWGWAPDDSSKGLWLVFGVGVVLVVLTVAIIFDSVWATLMVFLGLPVALAGAGAAFWIAGAAFNREAAVGVVLVVGLAVSHIILIVDAALQRRRVSGEGRVWRKLSGRDVIGACRDRFGMIVLVTATTLASLIPLAVGTDPDELFGAIALATIGGTIGCALAALVAVPAMLPGYLRIRRRTTKDTSSASLASA